jgi:hypothetical protein
MTLILISNVPGLAESLSIFALCACTSDAACGAHGTCVNKVCQCTGGYSGHACTNPTCVGVDCGPHGTCRADGGKGVCVCAAGFAGAKCDHKPVDPHCKLPYKTISDSWRSVSHDDKGPGGKVAGDVAIGTLCDDNMQPTGVGGGGWYRFSGSAGDAMPIKPPGLFHCGTDGGGWLSGWAGSGEPPVDFKTPGSLPALGSGLANRTVCFDFGAPRTCDMWAPISVVQCDGFYLWQLPYATVASGTKYCNHAYCTAPSAHTTA